MLRMSSGCDFSDIDKSTAMAGGVATASFSQAAINFRQSSSASGSSADRFSSADIWHPEQNYDRSARRCFMRLGSQISSSDVFSDRGKGSTKNPRGHVKLARRATSLGTSQAGAGLMTMKTGPGANWGVHLRHNPDNF
jgi:hypothetical protein